MYPKRSHILAPLTKMAGLKGKIPWPPKAQKAFDAMKALLAKEAFLAYPDHNLPFDIYTDASDTQLGSAIFQRGRPIAYFSRKLNPAQRNYTVGEKELLSIVETLKEFRTMLYGSPGITVYTDHKNNTLNVQTQRVMRWRLFLEDFGVKLKYIKGESNHLADALSRLPFNERQNIPLKPAPSANACANKLGSDDLQSYFSLAIDDDDLLDCFVNLPESSGIPFVLDYNTIRNAQPGDARLEQLRQNHPNEIVDCTLAPGVDISCYSPDPNNPWKIYLPTTLLDDTIRWYHLALGHLGKNRLFDSINQTLYHPDLRNRVEHLVTRCSICQTQKNVLRGHGELAPREVSSHPWREVAVDLIGPWTLTINNTKCQFMALTIIDQVTNLVELVRITDKTSAHVALQFENTWLSRYPLPRSCTHDQGGEFVGYPFQRTLDRHGIRSRPTTAKNPQSNAIVERMHQAVGNTLRALVTLTPPHGIQQANQLVDTALANCLFATRAAVNGSLKASPGSLAFGRDMILDIPLLAD